MKRKLLVSGKYVIVDDIQAAFQLLHPVGHKCLPPRCYTTGQGTIVCHSDNFSRDPPVDSSMSGHDLRQRTIYNTTDPVNAKLAYLYEIVERMHANDFRRLWTALCSMSSRQLHIIWQLARIKPTLGARALLNRTDITAHFAGEALLVRPCQPVQPEKIYWDYQVGETCYDALPVLSAGQLMFLIPGTSDLTLHAEATSCVHCIRGIHKGSHGWQTSQGDVHVTTIPPQLAWQDAWRTPTFQAPALFHNF